MHREALLLLSFVLLAGCVKDRNMLPVVPSDQQVVIQEGLVKVNEFVATASANLNEFGTASDWFELYNTSSLPLEIAADTWFVTDAGTAQPEKYALPATVLPAHGHLVVWCDGLDTVGEQIHANFSLSSAGEEIALYVLQNGSDLRIDGYAYAAQTDGLHDSGQSNALVPDGGTDWTILQVPTPGATNN